MHCRRLTGDPIDHRGIRYDAGRVALYTDAVRAHAEAVGASFVEPAELSGKLGNLAIDGMHPNAAGEKPVLETVWPYLQPLLKK